MTVRAPLSRRRFLLKAAASTAISAVGGVAKPYLSRAADRPLITHGIQSGDVSVDSGVIWARADRPARMLVEVATSDSFKTINRALFVDALPESDFTAKALIEGLPAGQDIFYRIRFQDLASPTITGEPMIGRFRTAPRDLRSISVKEALVAIWYSQARKYSGRTKVPSERQARRKVSCTRSSASSSEPSMR